ncbi:hypothetical protein [Kocuria turfanensis]
MEQVAAHLGVLWIRELALRERKLIDMREHRIRGYDPEVSRPS